VTYVQLTAPNGVVHLAVVGPVSYPLTLCGRRTHGHEVGDRGVDWSTATCGSCRYIAETEAKAYADRLAWLENQ
jgi:hypothetical protein